VPIRRQAPLPYQLVAGVEPCKDGWLVLSARVVGTAMTPQDPEVLPKLVDVLDTRPSYDVIALHAAVGVPDTPHGRACDRVARHLLAHRGAAVVEPPCKEALAAGSYKAARVIQPDLSPISWAVRKRVSESVAELAPFWQRTVWEVNPELGFLQLNDGQPLRHAKGTEAGHKERRALLDARLPGIERILDVEIAGVPHARVLDAAVDLWTARRVLARAVNRLPEDPEWDEEGVRMQLVY
jgi:predicted RNase H-like nuclease